MDTLDRIYDMARQADRHIVLAEGEDPRIQEGAARAAAAGLARITLIGDRQTVTSAVDRHGGGDGRITVLDPNDAPDIDILAQAYHRLRAHRGVDMEAARAAVVTPLVHAAMRVHLGHADGTVAGAVATTADTVRTALQIIGPAPGSRLVSSFFLMVPGKAHHSGRGGMIFSDCGLVVEPNATQLAGIARASAISCVAMLGEAPRVAMLSFSTAGSGKHASIDKIREALELVRSAEPDLEIDGEFQFDAAFDDGIRRSKAPASRLSGPPNVFIFPDLNAGNIGYKIAQRLGGISAIGPVLQGLARPANDLSRGCSAEDVRDAIAITALQAASAVPAEG